MKDTKQLRLEKIKELNNQNKLLRKQKAIIQERNQLLENSIDEMNKGISKIHTFVKSAIEKSLEQERFNKSIPEDQL